MEDIGSPVHETKKRQIRRGLFVDFVEGGGSFSVGVDVVCIATAAVDAHCGSLGG
jgi:hypothetical protein